MPYNDPFYMDVTPLMKDFKRSQGHHFELDPWERLTNIECNGYSMAYICINRIYVHTCAY